MKTIKEILNAIPKRLKSPIVWFGLVAVILSAAQISPENLTSWGILWGNIVATLSNPFLVGSILVAVFAFLNDPSNKDGF